MSTPRERGKQLENWVAFYLRQVLKDPSIRPTRASGGGQRNTELGDINNKRFVIECKNWTKKTISFSMQVWQKLVAEIPMNSQKIPMYVIEHEHEKFAILRFVDLCEILTDAQRAEPPTMPK